MSKSVANSPAGNQLMRLIAMLRNLVSGQFFAAARIGYKVKSLSEICA